MTAMTGGGPAIDERGPGHPRSRRYGGPQHPLRARKRVACEVVRPAADNDYGPTSVNWKLERGQHPARIGAVVVGNHEGLVAVLEPDLLRSARAWARRHGSIIPRRR